MQGSDQTRDHLSISPFRHLVKVSLRPHILSLDALSRPLFRHQDWLSLSHSIHTLCLAPRNRLNVIQFPGILFMPSKFPTNFRKGSGSV